MSDHKDTKLEIVDLLPNEIKTDPRYDVRPFERHATAECQQRAMEDLQFLADDIEVNGQLDAVCITPDHILICGHRRRRAVILINQRKSALGQPLRKLHCTVDRSGGDAILKAISSNLQRKNVSPIDLAYFLHGFRKERDLLGRKGVLLTAQLLHIPLHVIENSVKLMDGSKEVQNRLHEGVISTDTALMLMREGIPAPQLARVFERAREIQQETQTARIMDGVQKQTKPASRAARELAVVGAARRIERPAMVQSLKELHVNGNGNAKPAARPRSAPLSYADFLKGLTAADHPGQCRQARKLVRYLVKEYAAGKSSQAELERQLSLAFADEIPLSDSPQSLACY